MTASLNIQSRDGRRYIIIHGLVKPTLEVAVMQPIPSRFLTEIFWTGQIPSP